MNHSDAVRNRAWFAVITAAILMMALVTHLGSLQHEVIDWDESTFALMGSAVRHGQLPYLALYDNKPPLMFLVLGGAFWVGGESLLVLRMVGILCLTATCLLTWSSAKILAGRWPAVVAVAALLSVGSFEQSTMTEQLAAVLIVAALRVAIGCDALGRRAFAVGLLLSLATLTRQNLGIVVLAIGGFYALDAWRGRWRLMVAYIVGGLVPVGLLIGAYAAAGGLDRLWTAIVLAPLAYATGEHADWWELILLLKTNAMQRRASGVTISALSLLYSTGLVLFVLRWRFVIRRRDLSMVALFFTATFLSIAFSGSLYAHYFQQVYPLLSIALAVGLAGLGGRFLWFAGLLAALAMCGALVSRGSGAYHVIAHWREVTRHHEVRKIADFIAADRRPDDRVWAIQDHLILWYLQAPPVTPIATHPSNLVRSSIASVLARGGLSSPVPFADALSSRPRYVVVDRRGPVWYFTAPQRAALDSLLAKSYRPWRQVGSVVIYRRDP